MAGQADGSIIVDTELSPEGFKAGSSELLAAIKSLSTEIKSLGESIKSTFGSSGVGKSTQETDGYIQELQNRIKELEDNLAELKKQQISPQVDTQTQEQIRALCETVARLQSQLAETSKQPISPEVDIGEAEAKIAALEAKVLELEQVIASLQSGDQSAGANINFGGTTGSASALQRQIESVCNSVNNLEPTFQRAMNGSESAMTSFQSRASQLESKIASLKEKLVEMGNTQIQTKEYSALQSELDSLGKKMAQIDGQKRRFIETGGNPDSRAFQRMEYDANLVTAAYDRALAKKQQLESSGGAYISGTDTAQYQAICSTLDLAKQKLVEMQAELDHTNSKWAQMPTLSGYIKSAVSGIGAAVKSAFSTLRTAVTHPLQTADRVMGSLLQKSAQFVSNAARFTVSRLVTGLKTALSATKKLIASNKSYRNSFGGVLARIKQIGPALLMARGVMGMLRKAVNAYMQANQELANTLSSCWTGIGNLLGPIIERLINLLATAVAYFTAFLKLLGFVGKSASKAIGGAGGKAKEETDKLKRSLASFDDLNILSDNSSDEGGGGGGAGASELPPAELPDWAKLMANQLKNGDWKGAAKTLTNQLNGMVANVNWSALGTKIGGYLDGVLSFLATAITSFDWFSLGSNFAESVNSILYSVDWANLGIVLGAKIIVLLELMAGFFKNFDWVALGKALADAFMGLWNAIDWSMAAQMLNDGFIGLLTAIRSAVSNFDWVKIGSDIAKFINGIDWVGILSDLAGSISDILSAALDLLISFAENLDWGKLGNDIWNGLLGIITNIDWGGLISQAFQLLGAALGGATQLIWTILQNLWSLLCEAWDGTKSYFTEHIQSAGGDIIQGLWNGICEAFSNVGTWIIENIWNPFINGFKAAFGIASPSTKMAEQGNFIVQGLLQGITNAWSAITSFFGNALSSIASAISTAWSSIKSGASTAWSGIKSVISNAWSGIKTGATNAYTAVKTGVSSAWSSIKTATSTVWTNTKNAVSSAWDNIKTKSSAVGSDIANAASSAWSSVKNYISNSLNSAKSTVSTTWNSMKSTVTSVLSNISDGVSSKFTSIYTTINSKVSSFKSTISSGFEDAKNSITSKLSNALDTIKNQGWTDVGSAICTGIGNGISNGWSWLKNKVSNVATGLLDAAKSALGIHSPSRLFRDVIGLNIGYGVGEGIEASENSVLGSVTSVADAIAAEFAAGEYKAANIAPVTEVDGALTSFADQISGSFENLINKLQAIAETVTFRMPAIANSAVPYGVSAKVSGSDDGLCDALTASNDAVAVVIARAIAEATRTVVTAIQENAGGSSGLDDNARTTNIINEINRRTMSMGASPLL